MQDISDIKMESATRCSEDLPESVGTMDHDLADFNEKKRKFGVGSVEDDILIEQGRPIGLMNKPVKDYNPNGETSMKLEDGDNIQTDGTINYNSTEPDAKKRTLDSEPQLSKNQLRKQLKRDKWLANLPAKRMREKEKLKLKRQIARLNDIELGPSRKVLKDNKMSKSNCKVRVAIDMSFDDLMADKDISKCNKQLLRCYSINRRAENPIQLYITSFSGKSEIDMQKHPGYVNWDVHILPQNYTELFKKEDLVYLTSDSDNVISELDDNKVYIIGGLVDHNSEKGLCHKLAEEKGIAHGQLPISEYLQMKSRKVLAVNHVFELLLAVTTGKSWQEAFLEVLPQRKGAVLKTDKTDLETDKTDLEMDKIEGMSEEETS